jgi:hypothetical protein
MPPHQFAFQHDIGCVDALVVAADALLDASCTGSSRAFVSHDVCCWRSHCYLQSHSTWKNICLYKDFCRGFVLLSIVNIGTDSQYLKDSCCIGIHLKFTCEALALHGSGGPTLFSKPDVIVQH